jgi:hypothetical protein
LIKNEMTDTKTMLKNLLKCLNTRHREQSEATQKKTTPVKIFLDCRSALASQGRAREVCA